MNTFKKLQDGTWAIASDARDNIQAGSTITVTLRDGRTKQITVAHVIGHETGRSGAIRIFAIAEQPRPQAEQVGDLSGIMALFTRAQRHLRFPAIVLRVPGSSDTMRISVAGTRARFPGTINVTSTEPGSDNRRAWYGRINRAGGFEPGRAAPENVGATLRQFAADPAGVAAEHGRLTGRCCFCNHALEDERSTAVGYGPVCADHYGLPWGVRTAAYQEAMTARQLPPQESPQALDVVARYAAAVAAGQIADEPVTIAQMQARLEALAA